MEITCVENVTADCTEGSHLYTEVTPDTYTLSIDALDENGDVLYTQDYDEDITVLPGQTFSAFVLFE